MRVPFVQVDAFVDGPFTGNPAAVMTLPHWLDDAVLLAVAAETGLPATAFLVSDGTSGADFALRWFSPVAEMALCGHATLASGHVVLRSEARHDKVRFATRRSGVLEVGRTDDGYRMTLPALSPQHMPLPDIVAALGVGTPAATLWHPHGYAVVVLDDEAAVRDIAPDFTKLTAAGRIATIATAPGETSDIVSRVFVPAFGAGEDAVTGSAHAVIAGYWIARFGRNDFTARQLSWRGGRLRCMLDGDQVMVTGRCTTMIEGVFLLH